MLQNYQNILIAIDGSNQALLAYEKALEVAKRNKGKLYLANIIDINALNTISLDGSEMYNLLFEEANKLLDDYIKKAQEKNFTNIEKIVEFGSARELIARELISKYHIDLIMLGATGKSALSRLLLGSVSEYVTRTAQCDVLIVRTDLDNKK
ncbi:MAG: universal stress protein [Bacilli bacterium]|jgi:nucleotide-binding universal stress UspA family protein|nr:universal stress protein [Bacilli bacterium]